MSKQQTNYRSEVTMEEVHDIVNIMYPEDWEIAYKIYRECDNIEYFAKSGSDVLTFKWYLAMVYLCGKVDGAREYKVRKKKAKAEA